MGDGRPSYACFNPIDVVGAKLMIEDPRRYIKMIKMGMKVHIGISERFL